MFEKKMTEPMQRAAITAARSNGQSFEDIKEKYPHLKRVASAMQKEEQQKPAPKHATSGPTTMMARPTRASR